jgi:folate-binding protein YgfZ
MEEELKKRANLVRVQTEAGAVFDDNQRNARHFGDPRNEYQSARTGSALFDVSDRIELTATGDDRAVFLNNFCTNNVKALLSGQGCEAFVTNVQGKVVGHVFVFAAENETWIDLTARTAETLLAHLERYIITEDVELHAPTGDSGKLFLSGPEANSVLKDVGITAGGLSAYDHLLVERKNEKISVRRADFVGSTGFLLAATWDCLADLWSALTQAGARPAGAETFDYLRIEAGMPLYGVDVSQENLAQEVSRTAQAISFTKGCYLGQEPIARIDALGHVNRMLRGLRLEGAAPPRESAVMDKVGGEPIGSVTSSAEIPGEPTVALAYLRSKFTQPGGEVFVQSGASTVAASVFWPKGLAET